MRKSGNAVPSRRSVVVASSNGHAAETRRALYLSIWRPDLLTAVISSECDTGEGATGAGLCVPSAAFAIRFCPTRLASHSRGARREPICRDDEDRVAQPGISAQAKGRFDSRVPTHRQTGNRFHLILDPRRANLSPLMRHVNGVCP